MLVDSLAFDDARGSDLVPDLSTAGPSGSTSSPIFEGQGATRQALEAFVARRFHEVYGARLYTYMPHLFGATDPHGRLVAAFGLRKASQGALFLERYLDEPIEALIRARSGEEATRDQIAEVGNLAGATPGALRSLIPRLALLLRDEGIRWVAFTGSARICNGFARLGLPLQTVAPALIDRLCEEERACWGTYYANAPSVMIGDVSAGARMVSGLAEKPGALRALMAPLGRVGIP